MNPVKLLIDHRRYLLTEINRLESILKNYPAGYIQIHRDREWWKWRHTIPDALSEGSPVTHTIPQKKLDLAEKLCKKYELLKKKQLLTTQLDAIEQFIHDYPTTIQPTALDENPEYKRLLSLSSNKNALNTEQWVYEEYEKSNEHPESLIIPTKAGVFVRSKSEAAIANELYENNVPFRYEEKHDILGMSLFPDFSILHPITGEIVIWEHFGMMDSEYYRANAKSKMSNYFEANYLPGHNLILTFESKGQPLNPAYISLLVQFYFT